MQDTIDIPTRQIGIPVINFNGSFLVNSLEVGWLQIGSRQIFAVRVLFHQTLNYPVLAYENSAAEIHSHCFDARQSGKAKLEAYAPCYLVKDQQSDGMIPVIANITWYVAPVLHKRSVAQVIAVLTGDRCGTAAQPMFQGNPFAVFAME
jgi:hypothetical protein